ncbi:MAG: hypothetical protein HYT94_04430, partial [Parcubacteria group bacterium]|nr:hypothetical protein [Parcubacteria group bacterium]
MSYKEIETNVGKITLLTVFLGMVVIVFGMFLDSRHIGKFQTVAANTATTSVTVLNTPPNWTVDAQESTESSSSTPTNSGSVVTIVGTGTDDNAENYYLLICKTGSAPTANSGAAPTCNGGISNQWAVSASTVSGVQATAATTTTESFVEANYWFAWICDANATLPKCNVVSKSGTGTTASPFVVNHRPSFTLYIDTSPTLPGATVTWYSTSTDTDVEGTTDTVNLFVCKANDFTGTACGAGGTYCSSGLSASDPTCNVALATPLPDRNYTAYGFVIDNHNHAASGGAQGNDSVLTVSNATPTVSAASVSLLDTDEVGALTLTGIQSQTTGFKVKFTASDDNSCIANSSTTPEIATSTINVYRSGITSAGCDASGEFNANNCYTDAAATSLWQPVCTQDAGSCLGEGDSSSTWTCTFPLWYVADPTDASTQFPTENWLASVQVYDKLYATSTLTEGTTGTELTSFLAYSVATTSIAYGGLQPGQQNDPISQTTDMSATGNMGLNQSLYGDDMCTTYPSCSGLATNTVPAAEQKFATSSVAYASGVAMSSTTPYQLDVKVPKTTSTSSPQTKNTFWGIHIPSAIT